MPVLGVSFLGSDDYVSTSLEELIDGKAEGLDGVADPIAEIARIEREVAGRDTAAIVSSDDYPGAALASVLAKELGLPGPDPKVTLICQALNICRDPLRQRDFREFLLGAAHRCWRIDVVS